MGTTNWADIFSSVASDPDGATSASSTDRPATADRRRQPSDDRQAREHQPVAAAVHHRPPAGRLWCPTAATRRSCVPAVHHGRAVAVGAGRRTDGSVGWPADPAMGNAPNEPGQILVLLNVGAIFMGTALTVRDLIGERAIFRREQAVGLSTTAYLLAKVCIYAAFAIVQSTIVTTITVLGKGSPTQGSLTSWAARWSCSW
jgi:hypothetical protein